VTTYLLLGDTVHSPELRHELAEPVSDPIVFVEHEGRGLVVGPAMDDVVLSRASDDFWPTSALGYDELIRDASVPQALIWPELARRALGRLGAARVSVPAGFPVLAADHLRAAGFDVAVEPDVWADRRRRKTPEELAGIERAQRAAEAATETAARMLREAEPGPGDGLVLDGEELTAERIRTAMEAALLEGGAESDEIMIHTGDACLNGHDIGRGPILAGQSCVIDCFPRDRRSGAHSDMTRTFVPGGPASPELRRLHRHCRAALDVALAAIRPGTANAHAAVVEYFAGEGFPTIDHHRGEAPLREGFFHGLGHGVGLEVHEKPAIGRRAEPFVEGDVVAIEPGLYFPGVGGVRLEDTVVVTADGVRHLTEPYPYELEP
jgi:Xaa-Pro aminopeptidase